MSAATLLTQQARTRFERIRPQEARAEQLRGALLVDIRPFAQRQVEGEIPGSLVLERNVLEWRLDPLGEARIPEADSADLRVIIVCSEGYASSLAAVSLIDMGLPNATDLEGGFRLWRALGLPTAPGGTPAGRYVADPATRPTCAT
jgi:rhodanese-related sulfurtransferase